MKYKQYEIVQYHPDLLDGVLQALQPLWGDDHENNRSYFHWKYTQNPYTEKELGIVALHKNKVVAFRGYFATRWKISETEKKFIILIPGDVCVDPVHRRRHLALMTAKMARQQYEHSYPIFFSFSSNKLSTPLTFKQGYVPIVSRGYLNRYNLPGLARFALSSRLNRNLTDIAIPIGCFKDIEVSEHPKPVQMSDLASRQNFPGAKIYLDQDETFFNWRFENQRKKYVFYFCKKNNEITGYMVVRVMPQKNRGFIIDYAVPDEFTALKLAAFPIKNKHFNVLSISAYSVAGPMAAALIELNFKSAGILRSVEKFIDGEWPLFVRPVAQNFSDQDFYIEGIDIRNFRNWSLKEICSDGS